MYQNQARWGKQADITNPTVPPPPGSTSHPPYCLRNKSMHCEGPNQESETDKSRVVEECNRLQESLRFLHF